MYTFTCQYTHIYFLAPRSWFSVTFFDKRKQVSLEKWWILGLRQGIFKMSLEVLLVLESKEPTASITMAKTGTICATK